MRDLPLDLAAMDIDVDLIASSSVARNGIDDEPKPNNKDRKGLSLKSEERLEARKRRFFNETIHLVLNEHEGQGSQDERKNREFALAGTAAPINATSNFKVQRFRLNPDFVQHLIDRTVQVRAVTLAYLKASKTSNTSNTIIEPSDMQRLCEKSPVQYEMILSYPNRTKDLNNSTGTGADSSNTYAYQGQAHFVIRCIPTHSQNHLHKVNSNHVIQWIKDGILKEDQDLVLLDKNVKKLNRDLSSLNHKIDRIADDPDPELEGNSKAAERKRRDRYEQMLNGRCQIKAELDDWEKALNDLRDKKSSQIEMMATKCNVSDGAGNVYGNGYNDYNTWTVEILGEHRILNEKIVLDKTSWNTSFMYACQIERGEHDDFFDEDLGLDGVKNGGVRVHFDASEYLVDTANISVERVEHGFGVFHRPAHTCQKDSNVRVSNAHVDAYHGTYVNGRYEGFGMLYTTGFIYGGGFQSHLFHGEGTLAYKDGDVIDSNFGIQSYRASDYDGPQTSIGVGERDHTKNNRYSSAYTCTEIDGTTKITFSDGFYEGEMQNGTISGRGVYVDMNGERKEGEFLNGVLIKGTIRKSNGESISGTFKDGLLHGKGSLISKAKRCKYVGHFVDGEKHGMGEEHFYQNHDSASKDPFNKHVALAVYRGYFRNKERSGLGTLEFQDTTSDNMIIDEGVKDNLILKGPWLGGKPRAGGRIISKQTDSSMPTTNKLHTQYKFLNRFKKVEDHQDIQTEIKLLENIRVSRRYRLLVESKKTQMFEMHRKNVIEVLLSRSDTAMSPRKNVESEYHEYSLPKRPLSTPITTGTRPFATYPLLDVHRERKTIKGTLAYIEKLWNQTGTDFEGLRNLMDCFWQEYKLLSDRWEGLNLDKIRAKALEVEELLPDTRNKHS